MPHSNLDRSSFVLELNGILLVHSVSLNMVLTIKNVQNDLVCLSHTR